MGWNSVAKVSGWNREMGRKSKERIRRSKRKCTLVYDITTSIHEELPISSSLNLTLTFALSPRPNLSAFLYSFCMSKTLPHLASFQFVQVVATKTKLATTNAITWIPIWTHISLPSTFPTVKTTLWSWSTRGSGGGGAKWWLSHETVNGATWWMVSWPFSLPFYSRCCR